MKEERVIKNLIPFPFQFSSLFLLKSYNEDIVSASFVKVDNKTGLNNNRRIVCRKCKQKITTPDMIIEVNGNTRHTFINPAGVTFQIICFSSAEGCVVDGTPTSEFTWFEAYQWSFCICSGCLTHLGWFYESSKDFFWGLIRDQLEDTDDKP